MRFDSNLFFSAFYQVANILSINEDKLEYACTELGIQPLDCDEYAFLREYFQVISFVAATLKTLEANRFTFGVYIPTLLALQYNLQQIILKLSDINARTYSIETVDESGKKKTVSSNCLPLAYAIKNGFDNRFGELIDPFNENSKSVPLYVAMLANPTLKLNFMCLKNISGNLFIQLKQMLLSAAIKAYEEEKKILAELFDKEPDSDTIQNFSSSPTHGEYANLFFSSSEVHRRKFQIGCNLFIFITVGTNMSKSNLDELNLPSLLIEFDVLDSISVGMDANDYREVMKREVDMYFNKKPSSNINEGLNEFPNIYRVFLKFNCIRSSEAICERMFSYAGNFFIRF